MARAKRSPEATEVMRRDLVAAARTLIASEGHKGLTARRLAAKLGWAVGTIYTIAPTLDVIVLEANAAELADLRDALIAQDRKMTSGASPADRLQAMAETYVAFAQSRAHNWAAIFEREAEGDPPEWYLARQQELFDLAETLVRPLTDDDDAARRASRALWAALQGIAALAMAGHLGRVSDAGAEDLANYLVQTFIAGLKATKT
ncbi:MAG: TetR-like C-terminal domain-containing protein [Pseudomonadota bacterium]